jgi:hypothetical protein
MNLLIRKGDSDMSKFHGIINLGIKDKETYKILAVYPQKLDADKVDAEKTVLDWYYRQDCGTSENIENVYVDILTEREVKD